MSLLGVDSASQGITCGLLVVFYLVTMIHVIRGSKFRLVLLLTLLLMISNIGGVVISVTDVLLFV